MSRYFKRVIIRLLVLFASFAVMLGIIIFFSHQSSATPPENLNALPSQSATITPSPSISANALERARQFCSSIGGTFQSAQAIDGSPAQCLATVIEKDESHKFGVFIMFNSQGSVVPNPCDDYAWTQKYHKNQLVNNCGAPPEPIAVAKADCLSGAVISQAQASKLPSPRHPPPYYWDSQLELCSYLPIVAY